MVVLQRGDDALDEPFTDQVKNDLYFLNLGGIIDDVTCVTDSRLHIISTTQADTDGS